MLTASPSRFAPSTYSSGRKCSARGHGARDVETELRKFGERCVIAADDFLADERVRAQREIGRRRIAEIEQPQVVHDVAAADDQHTFVAQRRELPAELQMKIAGPGHVETELQRRHIGIRIHVAQDAPRAVVETLRRIDRDVRPMHELRDAARQRRIAGRFVAHIEQRLRETVEIVNRRRKRCAADR